MKLIISMVFCLTVLHQECLGSQYITYIPGELNVILTSPHGGNDNPDAIPDRTNGCLVRGSCVYTHNCGVTSTRCRVTSVLDGYTQELTNLTAGQLKAMTGKRPHVIINLLHRKKLDMNRDKPQATLGVREAEEAYDAYRGYILQAQRAIVASGKRGVLFDIHGVSSHSKNWIEIGYRISKTELNSGNYDAEGTSVRELGENLCGNNVACFHNLIDGANSLGGIFNGLDYSNVVPSPTNPSPGSYGYYRGGYTVETYGSKNGGNVDAIQIETPLQYRNPEAGPMYASNLAAAINQYRMAYYG